MYEKFKWWYYINNYNFCISKNFVYNKRLKQLNDLCNIYPERI